MMQRDAGLDIIRIVACFMVVLMHSPMPSESANGPFLVALSYMTEPCIGLFFMVSGALLLPVTKSYPSFLRRRLGKVVVPTISWTLIYIALKLYYQSENVNLWKSLLSLPFSAQGHGILWFMYTLIGLYFIAPILSAWLEKATKNDIQIILSLWLVTLCYPIIERWVDINTSPTGIFYYLSGYGGYFILGYYLKKHSTVKTIIAPGIIAATGAIYLLIAKRVGVEVDFNAMFGYLSIFVCSLTVCVWLTLLCLGNILMVNRLNRGGLLISPLASIWCM